MIASTPQATAEAEEGERMSDLTAIPVQSPELSAELASTWAQRATAFVSGLVFFAAVAFVGVAVVTVALVAGTVGAPVVAAAVIYGVFRSRRAQPALGPAR
jgi:hypothetical protein